MARMTKRGMARGMATVEAALLFGILLMLTFGVIEYGWVFEKSQQITNAARQGARIAARPDATEEEVRAVVSTLMQGAGITVYSLTMPDDIAAVPSGEEFTVGIRVLRKDWDLAGASLVPVPAELAASVTMVKEGP